MSGEVWGGQFAAHLRFLIRTLERNHLDPLAHHLFWVNDGLDHGVVSAPIAIS